MNRRTPIRSGILNTRMYYYWRRKWQPTPIKSHRQEPKGLQFMGSQRVRHDWATKHCLTIANPTVDFRPFLENYFLKFNSDFQTSMQLEWWCPLDCFVLVCFSFGSLLFIVWHYLLDALFLRMMLYRRIIWNLSLCTFKTPCWRYICKKKKYLSEPIT